MIISRGGKAGDEIFDRATVICVRISSSVTGAQYPNLLSEEQDDPSDGPGLCYSLLLVEYL